MLALPREMMSREMAQTGKYSHTHFTRGKRVKVKLRNGEEIVDKF